MGQLASETLQLSSEEVVSQVGEYIHELLFRLGNGVVAIERNGEQLHPRPVVKEFKAVLRTEIADQGPTAKRCGKRHSPRREWLTMPPHPSWMARR